MRRLIAAGTLLAVFGVGTFVWLRLGHWLSAADPVRRSVDVLVVPSGGTDTRLPAAIDYAEAGRAPEIWVVIGSNGPVLQESRAVRAFAREHGAAVPVRVIGGATSTREDAQRVSSRIDRLGLDVDSVAVVTAPWHVTRARLTFEKILGARADVLGWPDGTEYDAGGWWRSNPGVTVEEAAKLAASFIVLGPAPDEPGESVPLGIPVRAAVGGLVAAAAAGAAVRPLARRLGWVAAPRLRRAHARPTPLGGGLALLAGLGAGLLAGGGVRLGGAGIIAAAGLAVVALVGLLDDLAGLGAGTRLGWTAAAATAAWALGLRTDIFAAGLAGDILDAGVTIAWFVGVTHALNVLDNLDGAAAGVGAVSAATIAVVAVSGGQFVVAVGAASLLGACLGYLVHNVHPARLFMGDLGSLALGFSLATLAVALRPAQEPPVSAAVAVLALGVPIFDTALVSVARIRAGRPVWMGGTDHTSHRLLERGISPPRTAGTLWAAQAVLGVCAVVVALGTRIAGWVVVAVAAAAGLYALLRVLSWPPWTPPGQEAASEDVLRAFERTLAGLRHLDDSVRGSGLASADPGTARTVTDALKRLEAAERHLLSDEPG